MSELVPAETAKQLLGGAGGKFYRHSRDFRGYRSHSVKSESGAVRAHTGYGTDGGTAYADAELFSAAPDLAATVVAQAEQIDKVREVRSILNRLITYSGEAVAMDATDLAKSVVNKLNDALGDTDD